MKLDRNVTNAVLFSSAAALYPTVAYASTQDSIHIPVSLATYFVVFGAFSIATYKGIKKSEKNRLEDLHERIIPAEKRFIEFLKATEEQSTKSENEIDFEKAYLEKLEKEEDYLCGRLNIDKEALAAESVEHPHVKIK